MQDNARHGVCHIVGAAAVKSLPLEKADGDMIIAADGGYNTLRRFGFTPDITIGDFDSSEPPKEGEIIRLNPIKDITDTDRAVQYGREKGYCDFRIYGGMGGRESHTLANIQLMHGMAERGERCILIGDDETMAVLRNGEIEFSKQSRGYISVFSLDNESVGVCESGLKYTLDDYTLNNRFPLGVSNEFIGKRAKISVKNGALLLVYESNSAWII
ncbi:MAG: thiamine diphosphokinase [Acutalibacteraceae bacterium]